MSYPHIDYERTEYRIFTQTIQSNFEEESFKNLIYFYKEELIQLMRGKKASELFSPYTRKSLQNKGITRKFQNKTILTEISRKILKEIMNEK